MIRKDISVTLMSFLVDFNLLKLYNICSEGDKNMSKESIVFTFFMVTLFFIVLDILIFMDEWKGE